MYNAAISTNGSTAGTGVSIWCFLVPAAATKNIHVRSISIAMSGNGASGTYGVEIVRGTHNSAPTGPAGLTPSKGWSSHPTSILTSADLKSDGGLITFAPTIVGSSIGNILVQTLITIPLAPVRFERNFEKLGDSSLVFRPGECMAIRVIGTALVATLVISGSVSWDEDSI